MKRSSLALVIAFLPFHPVSADILLGLDAKAETAGTANNATFNKFSGAGVNIASPTLLNSWVTAVGTGGQVLIGNFNADSAHTTINGPSEIYGVVLTFKVEITGTHDVTFDKFAVAFQRAGNTNSNIVGEASFSTDGATFSPVSVDEVAVGGNNGSNNVGPADSIVDFRVPNGLGGSIGPQQVYVVRGLGAAGPLSSGSFYVRLTVGESSQAVTSFVMLTDRNDLSTNAMALSAANTTELGEDDGYDILWTGTSVPKGTTWTGLTDDSWINSENWSDELPGADGPAIFSGDSIANLDTNLDGDFEIPGVVIAGAPGPVSISGENRLTLGVEGLDASAATSSLSLNCPLLVNVDQIWNISTHSVVINSVISGNGNIKRIGRDGSLTLANANTFDGNITLENLGNNGYNGMIRLLHASGLGTIAGTTYVHAGTKLVLPQVLGAPVAEPLFINGNGGNGNPGALSTAGGDNTWSGPITLATSARINNNSAGTTLTLEGNVSATASTLTVDGGGSVLITKPLALGTGGLTKVGNGTLTLADGNTYGGETLVGAGTLVVEGDALPDEGTLKITNGRVQANGIETVNALLFGDEVQAGGTWGATGSGAAHIDDLHFSGTTGVVRVSRGVVTTAMISVTSIDSGDGIFTINWTIAGATGADLYRTNDLRNWTLISGGDEDGTHVEVASTGSAYYTLVPAGAEAP